MPFTGRNHKHTKPGFKPGLFETSQTTAQHYDERAAGAKVTRRTATALIFTTEQGKAKRTYCLVACKRHSPPPHLPQHRADSSIPTAAFCSQATCTKACHYAPPPLSFYRAAAGQQVAPWCLQAVAEHSKCTYRNPSGWVVQCAVYRIPSRSLVWMEGTQEHNTTCLPRGTCSEGTVFRTQRAPNNCSNSVTPRTTAPSVTLSASSTPPPAQAQELGEHTTGGVQSCPTHFR